MFDIVVEEKRKANKREYPYLGKHISTGKKVLFIAPFTGMVVEEPECDEKLASPVGYYTNQWIETSFKPISGTVTMDFAP